mmetsp:Transcript_12101/g.31362  ORF Transcript_12101/g.31362 Transcript_12101/m.31362 type:complete len:230 (-) Transcript_12101:168-857(-)
MKGKTEKSTRRKSGWSPGRPLGRWYRAAPPARALPPPSNGFATPSAPRPIGERPLPPPLPSRLGSGEEDEGAPRSCACPAPTPDRLAGSRQPSSVLHPLLPSSRHSSSLWWWWWCCCQRPPFHALSRRDLKRSRSWWAPARTVRLPTTRAPSARSAAKGGRPSPGAAAKPSAPPPMTPYSDAASTPAAASPPERTDEKATATPVNPNISTAFSSTSAKSASIGFSRPRL